MESGSEFFRCKIFSKNSRPQGSSLLCMTEGGGGGEVWATLVKKCPLIGFREQQHEAYLIGSFMLARELNNTPEGREVLVAKVTVAGYSHLMICTDCACIFTSFLNASLVFDGRICSAWPK